MKKITTPTVGMGASRSSGSDSYPMTVAKVLSPKKIVMVSCDSKLVDGSCGHDYQKYEFYPLSIDELNALPDNCGSIYTLRKNGMWIAQGRSLKEYWSQVYLGHHSKYHDPSF